MVQCDMSRAHEIQINCSSWKKRREITNHISMFLGSTLHVGHVYTDEKKVF